MEIIESVRTYIMECPYLKELAEINVEFLPDIPESYSIEQTPSDPILNEYLDGTCECQFTFVFACRMFYSDEVINNINNSGFFEKFQNWLKDNTRKDILPNMEEGYSPISIKANSSGYLFDLSGDLSNARYQIQCQLIYDKEA